MGKYTKYVLVLLYLVQIQVMFGEQFKETYHHFLLSLRVPHQQTESAEVAVDFEKQKVDVTGQYQEHLHQALKFLPPAVLKTAMREAHIDHSAEEHHPTDKDKAKRRHARQACGGHVANLFSSIRDLGPPSGHQLGFAVAVDRQLLFGTSFG